MMSYFRICSLKPSNYGFDPIRPRNVMANCLTEFFEGLGVQPHKEVNGGPRTSTILAMDAFETCFCRRRRISSSFPAIIHTTHVKNSAAIQSTVPAANV